MMKSALASNAAKRYLLSAGSSLKRAVIIMGAIRDQEKAGAGFTYGRNVA